MPFQLTTITVMSGTEVISSWPCPTGLHSVRDLHLSSLVVGDVVIVVFRVDRGFKAGDFDIRLIGHGDVDLLSRAGNFDLLNSQGDTQLLGLHQNQSPNLFRRSTLVSGELDDVVEVFA